MDSDGEIEWGRAVLNNPFLIKSILRHSNIYVVREFLHLIKDKQKRRELWSDVFYLAHGSLMGWSYELSFVREKLEEKVAGNNRNFNIFQRSIMNETPFKLPQSMNRYFFNPPLNLNKDDVLDIGDMSINMFDVELLTIPSIKTTGFIGTLSLRVKYVPPAINLQNVHTLIINARQFSCGCKLHLPHTEVLYWKTSTDIIEIYAPELRCIRTTTEISNKDQCKIHLPKLQAIECIKCTNYVKVGVNGINGFKCDTCH